ncbi:MAG TPA: heavy metal-binding domain-containing protein, partial [Flavisolibacter sp.]|nr:heavy metal-binding domain-containing protein [Flavisolibacter sp.]
MEQHKKYTCPMHPEIVKEGPGRCPICGMNLVPVEKQKETIADKDADHSHRHHVAGNANPPMGHEGHDHHAMMIGDFKKRFYVVLVLTIPIMLLSEMIQHWLNVHIGFPGSQYVLLALSSIVFFYGGWPFLNGWIEEMRIWKPGMMTLIGFAITVAYVYSVATVFGLKGMDFFWELATLILIMLL